MKRHWLWRAYFVVMVSFIVWGIGLYFFSGAYNHPNVGRHILFLPFHVGQFVGLYGYVYSRPIGSRPIWKLVSAGTFLDSAWTAYIIVTSFYKAGLFGTMVLSVFFLTVLGPLCISLYAYGFRSSELWSNRS